MSSKEKNKKNMHKQKAAYIAISAAISHRIKYGTYSPEEGTMKAG